MSNSPPSPGPDLFFAGGECLTRYGVWVRRTDVDFEESTRETATRNSEARAIGRDGELRTWAIDTPRSEWLNEVDLGIGIDEDRKFPSLFLEDAGENAWTNSESLEIDWALTRATFVTNATTAPDGTQTAEKLQEDNTAASSHRASRTSPTGTIGQLQTLSLFARQQTGLRPFVVITTNTPNARRSFFNVEDGTLGTIDPAHDVTMRAYPNSWYRITVVFDNESATSGAMEINISDANDNVNYDGDGTSGLFLWGLQFEVDTPVGSSYIKTAGVTATRAEDIFFAVYPHPPQALTAYAKFIEAGTVKVGGDRLWEISDPTGLSPFLKLDASGGVYRFTHNNGVSDVESLTPVGPAVGDLVEIVAQLSDAGVVRVSISINGGAPADGAGSSGLDLAGAWSGDRFYINNHSGTNRVGLTRNLALKLHRGTRDLDFMRAL